MHHPRGEAPSVMPHKVRPIVRSLIPIQTAVEFLGAHTGPGP
jgi:hypothetical protein